MALLPDYSQDLTTILFLLDYCGHFDPSASTLPHDRKFSTQPLERSCWNPGQMGRPSAQNPPWLPALHRRKPAFLTGPGGVCPAPLGSGCLTFGPEAFAHFFFLSCKFCSLRHPHDSPLPFPLRCHLVSEAFPSDTALPVMLHFSAQHCCQVTFCD